MSCISRCDSARSHTFNPSSYLCHEISLKHNQAHFTYPHFYKSIPTRSSSYSIRPCPSCGFTIAEGIQSQHGARSQRVEELLRSNESPQDSERVSLAGFVADGRRRLGVLDSQISLARQVLDALAQDRQELQRDIEDHQIILNPARRIPEEILRQFFLACVEEDTDTPVMPSTTLDSHHLPWTLAQVSSRWRAIAISFPRLWATICITLTADDLARPEVCQRLQLHLGAQLHRSSSYALSIWLNFLCDIPASHPLLHILLPSSPRWKYLFLRARLFDGRYRMPRLWFAYTYSTTRRRLWL